MTETRVQWFKNGDHPQDYSRTHHGFERGVLRDFPPEERKARAWEGDVVRYFRHPDVHGHSACDKCGATMHHHGWIDSGAAGETVCPGDWIISNGGQHHVRKESK